MHFGFPFPFPISPFPFLPFPFYPRPGQSARKWPKPAAGCHSFCQDSGYLPNGRASPTFGRYQIILLVVGSTGSHALTTGPGLLPENAGAAGSRTHTTYWSQVQRQWYF